ncbi:hypothetical protein GLOIN_2v1883110 [Rhizophagus clarus]|uniref:CCHC-type domain-containing protein n=1 Tax=Rhizophagus clarus TaxID=94130 RepID=A0A8H3QP00_9GLOM|nr:hypothetical protein GLOIN_2v1883110 [Rhizophagus clarus]
MPDNIDNTTIIDNNNEVSDDFYIIDNPNAIKDILSISVNHSITIKNNSSTIQMLITILQERLTTASSTISPPIVSTSPLNVSAIASPFPSVSTYESLSDSISSLSSSLPLDSSVTLSSITPLTTLISSISSISSIFPISPNPPISSNLAPSSNLNFICTSEGIALSSRTNWIAPIGSYKDPCYLCEYYGHGFNTCPNIQQNYWGRCCRCWVSPHESKDCHLRRGEKVPIPFKKNFLKQADLIKFFGRIEE